MQNIELQHKLAEAFKMDEMSAPEREAFLTQAGSIVIDAALGRLLLSLSETEVAQLELYLDTHEQIDDPLTYLLETYPTFEGLLEEEALALQSEAAKVVLPSSTDTTTQ